MSETKHTPGPWRTASYDHGISWKVETAESRRAVASYVAGLRGECEANARLIAAAPDLLAALKAAAQFIYPDIQRGPASNGWQMTVESVEAALAKAEGR